MHIGIPRRMLDSVVVVVVRWEISIHVVGLRVAWRECAVVAGVVVVAH